MEEKLKEERIRFVKGVVSERKGIKENDKMIKSAWRLIKETDCTYGRRIIIKYFNGKNTWESTEEERDKVKEWLEGMPVAYEMLVYAIAGICNINIVDYYGRYVHAAAEKAMELDTLLEELGFSYTSEEEKQVMDGSHQLYKGRA